MRHSPRNGRSGTTRLGAYASNISWPAWCLTAHAQSFTLPSVLPRNDTRCALRLTVCRYRDFDSFQRAILTLFVQTTGDGGMHATTKALHEAVITQISARICVYIALYSVYAGSHQ